MITAPRTASVDTNSRQQEPGKSSVIVSALACLLAMSSVHAGPPPPELSIDSHIATAGFYRLSWTRAAGQVELQEASDPDFRNSVTYYTGHDSATLVSGKPDGRWYYRIRVAGENRGGDWSEPVAITVAHHSLDRALLFLSLGVIVFSAVVLVIARGPGKPE